jgi:hypothetical protein
MAAAPPGGAAPNPLYMVPKEDVKEFTTAFHNIFEGKDGKVSSFTATPIPKTRRGRRNKSRKSRKLRRK